MRRRAVVEAALACLGTSGTLGTGYHETRGRRGRVLGRGVVVEGGGGAVRAPFEPGHDEGRERVGINVVCVRGRWDSWNEFRISILVVFCSFVMQ